ncbi:hypothetical protein [Dactylosporangium sp. NPDC005555]|uniref:hypothetical protein n=1 Tax=Dactylosporangium sp. NPDC005555 TaxID=3154889 RepID=UPI0033A844CF
MAVPARRAAVAALAAAVTASGTAMLSGAGHTAPAGRLAAVQVSPAPGPARVDRPMPVDPSASGSVAASPSMSPPPPGSSPFASGSVWAAVNCATVRIRLSGGGPPTDSGGPLVPPAATSVTRCETPLASKAPAVTGVAAPRVLTGGVDRLTAVLNALPTLPAEQACLPITMPVQLSLVFTFRAQEPLVVVVDPTCSALIAGDRARSYTTMNPIPVFDALFSAQPSPG